MIADTLSRKYSLLSILGARILGFEIIKEQSSECLDFAKTYKQCIEGPKGMFCIQQGFLFKGNQLCIPKTPLRLLLVKEVHEGSMGGGGSFWDTENLGHGGTTLLQAYDAGNSRKICPIV